ncbi:MAG: CNNM domain-containing protein [Planctomycetota bacterium]
MTATLLLAAALLVPLLLISGVVSGSETALFGLNHAARTRLRNQSPAAARAVGELLDRPRPLLTALLAANMLINVSYFSISSIFVVELEAGGSATAAAGLAVGSLVAIILIGEIGAKLLASTYRVGYCRLVASPWLLLMRLGWPTLSLVDRAVISPMIRIVGKPSGGSKIVGRSSETLAGVLSTAVELGEERSASDQRLILGVIRLGRTRVREAMSPRARVPTLPADAGPDEVLAAFRDRNNLLVLDSAERPVGWVHAPRYLARRRSGHAGKALTGVTTPCVFLPEQATLDAALTELRREQRDRAVVVDELGEFVGVLRVEDIANQLLDEPIAEATGELPPPTLVALGVFEVAGRWPARPLLIDLDIPHDQAERILARVSTVGGLMLGLLGRFPVLGDTASLPGATLTVAGVDGREITSLSIRFDSIDEAGEPAP